MRSNKVSNVNKWLRSACKWRAEARISLSFSSVACKTKTERMQDFISAWRKDGEYRPLTSTLLNFHTKHSIVSVTIVLEQMCFSLLDQDQT